jgi:hypothetical protein
MVAMQRALRELAIQTQLKSLTISTATGTERRYTVYPRYYEKVPDPFDGNYYGDKCDSVPMDALKAFLEQTQSLEQLEISDCKGIASFAI